MADWIYVLKPARPLMIAEAKSVEGVA